MMREIIRKREQEKIEMHDEIIYYDAGTAHSNCFSFFCCPHYGKITSERVIYSAQPPPKTRNLLKRLVACFDISALWKRKVETMDIDHLLDVGVAQACSSDCVQLCSSD